MITYAALRTPYSGLVYILRKAWGEFESPLCLVLENPAYVALGKLYGTRVFPEEGNDKSFLSLLYLGKLRRDCHKSELT